MKFRITGRQGGKTTELATIMRYNSEAILIVHMAKERDRLEDKYPYMKGRIFTPPEIQSGVLHKRPEQVYIDNLDLILPLLLKTYGVDVVTATGEVID